MGEVVAVLLAAMTVATGVAAETGTAIGPAAAPCAIINRRDREPGAVPLLLAVCGENSVIVGEADSYKSAYNNAHASLLIVRKRGYRVHVSLVATGSGPGGAEDLTPGIERQLGKAGRLQSPLLDVDISGFAAKATLLVTPKLLPAIAVEPGSALPVTMALAIDLTPVLVRAMPPTVVPVEAAKAE